MNKKAFFGIIIIGVIILALIGAWFLWNSFTNKINNQGNDNSDGQLIGGCAGVSLENLQECCDNWAIENEIVHVACVGSWEIKDNLCGWVCD